MLMFTRSQLNGFTKACKEIDMKNMEYPIRAVEYFVETRVPDRNDLTAVYEYVLELREWILYALSDLGRGCVYRQSDIDDVCCCLLRVAIEFALLCPSEVMQNLYMDLVPYLTPEMRDTVRRCIQEPNSVQCGICHNATVAGIPLVDCNHVFCTNCMDTWRDMCRRNKRLTTCPMCRTPQDFMM